MGMVTAPLLARTQILQLSRDHADKSWKTHPPGSKVLKLQNHQVIGEFVSKKSQKTLFETQTPINFGDIFTGKKMRCMQNLAGIKLSAKGFIYLLQVANY